MIEGDPCLGIHYLKNTPTDTHTKKHAFKAYFVQQEVLHTRTPNDVLNCFDIFIYFLIKAS